MDNFDLKKFLKESKALENLNPAIKSLNETSFSDRGNTQDHGSSYPTERPDGTYDISNIMKETLKAKIKEMIVAELAEDSNPDANPNLNDFLSEDDKTKEEEDEYIETLGDGGYANFGEAKKKDKEEVDVEDVEVTGEEDVPAADAEVTGAEDVPAADGGLEDIAADMEGTEGELMDSLMKAFKIAKGMNNEKLETQVGNTLKFFVSEYIGGGED